MATELEKLAAKFNSDKEKLQRTCPHLRTNKCGTYTKAKADSSTIQRVCMECGKIVSYDWDGYAYTQFR